MQEATLPNWACTGTPALPALSLVPAVTFLHHSAENHFLRRCSASNMFSATAIMLSPFIQLLLASMCLHLAQESPQSRKDTSERVRELWP